MVLNAFLWEAAETTDSHLSWKRRLIKSWPFFPAVKCFVSCCLSHLPCYSGLYLFETSALIQIEQCCCLTEATASSLWPLNAIMWCTIILSCVRCSAYVVLKREWWMVTWAACFIDSLVLSSWKWQEGSWCGSRTWLLIMPWGAESRVTTEGYFMRVWACQQLIVVFPSAGCKRFLYLQWLRFTYEVCTARLHVQNDRALEWVSVGCRKAEPREQAQEEQWKSWVNLENWKPMNSSFACAYGNSLWKHFRHVKCEAM